MLALTGCMKIYPDPELPDLEVTWSTPFERSCDGGEEILVTVIGIDDPTTRLERAAACTDEKIKFADVARERFRIEGVLRAPDGTMLDTFEPTEADLRNGWDTEAYLWLPFDDGSFSVVWMFDMGESCESLSVQTIVIELADSLSPEPFVFAADCVQSLHYGNAPVGSYTVVLSALAGTDIVAVSEPREVELPRGMTTNIGSVLLVPCNGPCR